MVEKLANQPDGVVENAEFRFTDEQAQLRTAVRKFCAENFSEPTVRTLMESEPRFDPSVWARLGAELGVLGLAVPEADGGAGGTLVDQAIAVEELGAALACGPVFGTVLLASRRSSPPRPARCATNCSAPSPKAPAPQPSRCPTRQARSTPPR